MHGVQRLSKWSCAQDCAWEAKAFKEKYAVGLLYPGSLQKVWPRAARLPSCEQASSGAGAPAIQGA